MKKFLAILLVLAMTLSLAACGATGSSSKTPEQTSGQNSDKEQTSGQTETSDKTPEETTADPGNAGDGSVDLSKYPADFNDWTAQNLIDYYTEAGVFTAAADRETWLQDHANYWSDTPINECGGYWNDEGSILIMFFTFDENVADTTAEEVQEMMDFIREKKQLTEDYMSQPIDHLAGNVAFSFIYTTEDDVYEAAEAAYEQLMSALGVTPEF